MILHRSTIQLLRFHFSLFLLPVYLFAISQVAFINWPKATMVGLVLHLLIYPASNGYNSFMDRDVTPIGGLFQPLQPKKQLFWVTVIMDVVGLLISFWIHSWFALGIMFYIIASRAYSYRRIRLKQYPVAGFLTVFVFQGAWIFSNVYFASNAVENQKFPLLPAIISSLLVGALYPLTQIYQHETDMKDGVITISYLLGKRGSFVFSGFLFAVATLLLYYYFTSRGEQKNFLLFLLFTLPVVSFFCYWMFIVWKKETLADFKHSLYMNVVATFCLVAFFIMLIIKNHFE